MMVNPSATSATDLFFLVGCPRSGTTLLQQMLDAHPAIAVAPETHFIRRFWLHRARYPMDTIEEIRLLVDAIIALPEFSEMRLDPHHYRSDAIQLRDHSSLLRLLLSQFAIRQGKQIVGEKTPNHLLYMEILKELFPDARFVHLVRDPRAVVNSWRTVPWSRGSPRRDAEVWQRYESTARKQYRQLGDAIITIYYEDLLTNPRAVLSEVCGHLGVAFTPTMLDYHAQTSTINVVREPWKKRATEPLDVSSHGRWRIEMPMKTIREVETVVWKEMTRHGYKAISHPAVLIPIAAWTSALRGLHAVWAFGRALRHAL